MDDPIDPSVLAAILSVMVFGTVVFDVLVVVCGWPNRPPPRQKFSDVPGERCAYCGSDNLLVGSYIGWGILCLVLTSLIVFRAPLGWTVAFFVAWTVMPSIWYVLEHVWFYPNRGLRGSREYYEHGRLTSATLWLAGSIICFVAIQAHDDGDKQPAQIEQAVPLPSAAMKFA